MILLKSSKEELCIIMRSMVRCTWADNLSPAQRVSNLSASVILFVPLSFPLAALPGLLMTSSFSASPVPGLQILSSNPLWGADSSLWSITALSSLLIPACTLWLMPTGDCPAVLRHAVWLSSSCTELTRSEEALAASCCVSVRCSIVSSSGIAPAISIFLMTSIAYKCVMLQHSKTSLRGEITGVGQTPAARLRICIFLLPE